MNEILNCLHARRSVRAFTGEPVTPDEKRLILEAAIQAPTAGNQQLYTILDVTDQALKDRLAESCDHQPFIAKAPLVLVFCADCRKWYDAYLEAGCDPRPPGPGDLLLAVDDALIAAQNAVIAAESLGLGSCYIGDVMEYCKEHRALLHLPQWVFPASLLVIGRPAPGQKERTGPKRVELKHIVHENTYRTMEGPELREMFTPRSGSQGYDAWMTAFCKRKYLSAFSREMSRSVAEYLEQFTGGSDKEVSQL